MRVDNRFKIMPFHCFCAENCTNYIGQKGYFENEIDFFKCIDLCKYGTLEKIFCDQAESFQMKETKKDYKFFIPEYFVVPKEKKYRPFTLQEFCDIFTIGQPIKYRRKGKVGLEHEIILDGYAHEQIGDQTFTYIYIGVNDYTLDELFEEYEWQESDTGEFKPFGVEE